MSSGTEKKGTEEISPTEATQEIDAASTPTENALTTSKSEAKGTGKHKKKSKSFIGRHKVLFIVLGVLIVAIIVAFAVVLPMLSPKKTTTTIQSATVSKGSVSVTVSGTGTLTAANDIDVTVPNGVVVDTVLVSAGDSVTEGQNLASVTPASVALALVNVNEELDDTNDAIDDLDTSDTDDSLRYVVLDDQRTKLEAAQATLNAMVNDPYIKSTSAGVVGTVDISDGSTIGSGSSTSSSSTSSSSNTSGSSSAGTAGASGASSTSKAASIAQATVSQASYAPSRTTASATLSTAAATTSSSTLTQAASTSGKDSDLSTSVNDKNEITKLGISIEKPETDATPQTKISGDSHATAVIEWNPADKTFKGNTEYTATVKVTAKDGFTFTRGLEATVSGAKSVSTSIEKDGTLSVKVAYEPTKAGNMNGNGNGNMNGNGNINGNMNGNGGSSKGGNSSSQGSGGTSSASGISISGLSSSGGSSSSSSGTSSTTDTSADLSINTYETTAFELSSGSKVAVSMTIDEDDILSVKTGQTASVTIDATGEETAFTGTVTKVTTSGSTSSSSSSTGSSSSSGSVKYSATVQMDKTDQMLLGMSASVVINVSDSGSNSLVIPVSALQEQGNRTFVYTSNDDGTLGGEVEVQTGVSNGTQVQITSGLSEGQTVYYLKSTSTDSSSNSSMPGGMGGDMGGGMPGGGSDSSGGHGNHGGGDMQGGGGTPPSAPSSYSGSSSVESKGGLFTCGQNVASDFTTFSADTLAA